jgi:hypothetical protein
MKRPDSPAIEPGECLGRFNIDSDHMPGFLLAGFSAFGTRFQPDRTWPEEVFDQMAYYEELTWFQKNVITIGPALPPATPRKEVAANFDQGLRELVQEGRLQPQSPFVKELSGIIETLLSKEVPSSGLRLTAVPSSQEELGILRAAQLSLKIASDHIQTKP